MLVPGWMAGQQLRRSELFSGLEEEVNNQSFRQDDFEVLVEHSGSHNAPKATVSLDAKLQKEMQGGDSDWNPWPSGCPERTCGCLARAAEGEGAGLQHSTQNPNIYRAERGREEPLKEERKGEQKGRGVTEERGVP